MKYAWIKEHRDEYSVVRLCHAMQVSKSGFYSWLNSEPSPRKKRTDSIRKAVLEVYQESNSIYGSYKIAEVLKSCLLYTSPSPRDRTRSRMPSSA